MLFDRKQHEVRVGLQAVLIHYLILVIGDCSRFDLQQCAGFFHGVALGKKLNYFNLPLCKHCAIQIRAPHEVFL